MRHEYQMRQNMDAQLVRCQDCTDVAGLREAQTQMLGPIRVVPESCFLRPWEDSLGTC